MGKFGKNDWKIAVYKVVSGVVTVGVIAALAVNAPKVLKKFEFDTGEKKTATMGTGTVIEDNETMEVLDEAGDAAAAENTSPSEPTKVSLMASAPNLDDYYLMPVIAADSSSTIKQQGVDNSPMVLFDGLDDTNWQEGVEGHGINEYVAFSFDAAAQVKYIGFKLGNWKSDKYYFGNARPKTMTIIFGDYSGQITFEGDRETEWVEVNHTVTADSMRVIIDDVYPGSQWEDTCMTEIMVYAKKQEG